MFNNELGLQNIKVSYIKKIDDYLFIILNNGQKILTNGNEVYDVSKFDNLSNLFKMNDKFCAVMKKESSTYVVDLKTNEVLFEDDKAYHISKQDDRTLHVLMKRGCENDAIYDIKTKKYLYPKENYKFENSLGNNLYVFRESNCLNTDFYNYKRCVINADGKIILKDIDGWIALCDNFIIIEKSEELCVVKMNDDLSLTMNSIQQNEKIIAKPEYYDGHIIIMEKGSIKIFTPDLSLIHQFEIKELESVIDYEIVANTLKICLPYSVHDEIVNKHLFVNLENGTFLSHLRIDGYPYWTPKVYVGKDDLSDEQLCGFEYGKTYEKTEYHFYDSNFNKITAIKGNFYSEIDNENIFVVGIWDGKDLKRKYMNAQTGEVKDCNYDVIQFSPDNLYGYAFNTITDMMDIVDHDLNVIIQNIDYKQLDLPKDNKFFGSFNYFVVNDYVCIIKRISNGPCSFYRYIIYDGNGKIVFDSMEHTCYAMGNFIQIVKDGKSKFLDTLTGEIGQLSITVPTDEYGKINFSRINDLKNIFQISSTNQSLLPSSSDQSLKVKKLIPNTKKDSEIN